jgi:hypothetical protein
MFSKKIIAQGSGHTVEALTVVNNSSGFEELWCALANGDLKV